jgi:hypothetical protein
MLFVPFGVLGGLACRRRVPSQSARVALVTAAGASLSVLVEALQLLTTDRVTAASDVATNMLGAFVGVLAVDQTRRHALSLLREHGASRWLSSRWTYPALIALGVLLVSAWQPFDLTLDVSTVGSKVRALTRDPWQSGPWTDEGNAIVLYALATWRWLDGSTPAASPGRWPGRRSPVRCWPSASKRRRRWSAHAPRPDPTRRSAWWVWLLGRPAAHPPSRAAASAVVGATVLCLRRRRGHLEPEPVSHERLASGLLLVSVPSATTTTTGSLR